METVDDEIVLVVKRLAKAVSEHGVRKVVAVLDQLNSEKAFIEAHQSLIKFIMKATASEFKVAPEDMKKRNIRGTTIDARNMCCILIKKYLDLNHKDVAWLFKNKSHSIVSHAITFHSNLNPESKADRKYLEIFTAVDKRVEKQKEMLWLKHS